MAKVANDFEKIIKEGRERKQNEALAAKIFSKDRRASAPLKASGTGPSLASRVGVKKRSSLGPRAQTTAPAGNINGEWTHDLHNATLPKPKAANTKPNSLASRLHAPGTKPPAQQQQARQQRRAAQTAQALIKAELDPVFAAQQVNVVKGGAGNAATSGSSKSVWKGQGMTIRGLAGPFVVMAQNFAPGTTAADIESAMTPVGGLVSSCRLLKTQPIVIAEIVFESKEGAENVIETFNNQTADGRVLHVYPKAGGPSAVQRAPPTGPRAASATTAASSNTTVVDGSLGFDDPMDTDTPASRPRQNGRAGGGGGGGGSGLYSDQLVGNGRGRGRGFQRGGRGGAGR